MRFRVWRAFVLCALALLLALGATALHPRRPPWTWKLLRDESLWVEATPPRTGAPMPFPEALRPLPGDWDGFLSSLLERWRPGQPVMVHCEGKYCAEAEVIAQRLHRAGMDRVYVLRDPKP